MPGKKTDAVTKIRRVRQVQEWMLEGHTAGDIIQTIKAEWNITERMAANYVKEAKEEFKRLTADKLKEAIGFHLAARMKLFKNLKDKDKHTGASTALEILRDAAKLLGLYTDKMDIKSGGEKINQSATANVFLSKEDIIEISKKLESEC